MKNPNKIRDFRKKKRWTQKRLADVSGVPRENISRYENGIGNPTVGMMQKMADALGVTVSDLVGVQQKEEIKLSEKDIRILSVVKESHLSIEELIAAINLYQYAHAPRPLKPVPKVELTDDDYKNTRHKTAKEKTDMKW